MSRKSKQWCFNRKISLRCSIDYYNNDDIIMAFEFEDVNTFLSVDLLKQWFMDVIYYFIGQQQYLKFKDYFFQFVNGQCHFIRKHESMQYNAIAYFEDLQLNVENILNPNINNIPITLNVIPYVKQSYDQYNYNEDSVTCFILLYKYTNHINIHYADIY